MKSLSIKFRRFDSFDLESYGPEVLSALDQMIGGADRWDLSVGHGAAKLGKSKAHVRRHEDGPEIIGLLIENLPAYLTALTGLIALWWSRPKKKKKDSTQIEINDGKLTINVPIGNDRDVKTAQDILAALSQSSKEKGKAKKSGARR